ncbi:MAG: hypothetical protein AAF492_28350, partial [Verrucomicrobiota bacterium]
MKFFRKISFGLILFLPAFARAADPGNIHGREKISETDQVKFSQESASAHMQELEERMFQLADLIRDVEPENAARLRMALKQSREELILEQMASVLDLLDGNKLEEALGKEKDILHKLQELRELLVTLDLDFRIKLERLKQFRKAMAELKKIIEEEKRQIGANEELAEGEPGDFDRSKADQEDNREVTDALAEQLDKAGA